MPVVPQVSQIASSVYSSIGPTQPWVRIRFTIAMRCVAVAEPYLLADLMPAMSLSSMSFCHSASVVGPGPGATTLRASTARDSHFVVAWLPTRSCMRSTTSSLVGPPSAVNCPSETGAAPGAAASRAGSGAAGAGSARSATAESVDAKSARTPPARLG